MHGTHVTHSDADTALMRWSAVFGGLILGLGLLMVLTSLFLALAYGSEVEEIRRNLSWFIGGSAIAALFVGAIFTGYLSGVRSVATGMLHGFALWGLLLALTITVGVPSILNVFNLGTVVDEATEGLVDGGGATALWASFWTLVGGFVAAGLGGAIGGAASRGERTDVGMRTDGQTRPVHAHEDDVVEVRDEDVTRDEAHAATHRRI